MSETKQMSFRLSDKAFKYKEGKAPVTVVGAEISKVEYSEADGFFTWFKDAGSWPVNGFPDINSVFGLTACDSAKKYIKSWLVVASSRPVRYVLPFFIFIPKKERIINTWLKEFADFSVPTLKEFIFEPQFYSRPVKEIHRVLSLFGEDEVTKQIADAVCMILEYDRPYRYRFQDMLSIFNVEALKKNPAKEVKRVIEIFVERDKMRPWKSMGWLVWAGVRFIKPIREAIVFFVTSLDMSRITLSNSDKYHCYLNFGYTYNGEDYERRAAEWTRLHDTPQNSIPTK